jgi:hypothetical protein
MGMPLVSARFKEIENELHAGNTIDHLRSHIESATYDLESIIKAIQEDVISS